MKEIRANKLPVKIIAQTAYAFPDDQHRCMMEGCDGYLSKPLNRNDLYAMIKKVMNT